MEGALQTRGEPDIYCKTSGWYLEAVYQTSVGISAAGSLWTRATQQLLNWRPTIA